MNNLTALNIQHLTNNISHDIILHPTSIAYIQSLLSPYAQVLDQASSVNHIIDWLPKALPGLIDIKSLNTPIEDLSRLKGGLNDGPEFVQLAKSIIIDKLISRLIISVNDDILFYKGDNMILPWDILESTSFDDTLRERLGILKGQQSLPVQIIIENIIHNHEFTEEFTMGLLLYSLVSQKPLQILLFGIPLNNDYFLNPNGNRYTKFCHNARRTEYSIIIGGVNYCFITIGFIHGFITGASWYNDDHHRYWSNLISYEMDPKGIQVNF